MGGSQGLELLTVKIGVLEAEESEVSRDFICPVCMAWGSGRLPSACPQPAPPLCPGQASYAGPGSAPSSLPLWLPHKPRGCVCTDVWPLPSLDPGLGLRCYVCSLLHTQPLTRGGGGAPSTQSLFSDPFIKTRRL